MSKTPVQNQTAPGALRSTCIKCKRKRFQSHLQQFAFKTWLTPVTESTSYHFACIDKPKLKYNLTCYEVLIHYDLNCVIMPYSKKK